MIMVHDSIWNRKIPKKRGNKKDAMKCTTCARACDCACGWVCKECRPFADGADIERDMCAFQASLDALMRSEVDVTPFLLDPAKVRWLDTTDCEYSDELRDAASLGARLSRVQAYFATLEPPYWDRPPPAERALRAQVGPPPPRHLPGACEPFAG
jgi:hypothetical protein